MNGIFRLILKQHKAIQFFCLFLAKILVGFLVSFSRQNQPQPITAKQVKCAFVLEQIPVSDFSRAGGRSMGK